MGDSLSCLDNLFVTEPECYAKNGTVSSDINSSEMVAKTSS